jgi:putative alpha-1,2-mannosidase
LALGNGRTLVVEALNNSPTNVYVARVLWNGVPLSATTIAHATLLNGGTLTFEMSATPDTPFNRNNDRAVQYQQLPARAA